MVCIFDIQENGILWETCTYSAKATPCVAKQRQLSAKDRTSLKLLQQNFQRHLGEESNDNLPISLKDHPLRYYFTHSRCRLKKGLEVSI